MICSNYTGTDKKEQMYKYRPTAQTYSVMRFKGRRFDVIAVTVPLNDNMQTAYRHASKFINIVD
jgi:hypothetical protein